jgi:hypothetical protein
MSLVIELQSIIEREREDKLREIALILGNRGISASLSKKQTVDYLGAEAEETIIHFENESIQNIRLVARQSGADYVVYRYCYEILLDEGPSSNMKKAIKAKLRLIKTDKNLGLFGGTIVGARWDGRVIAETLNSDEALLNQIVDYVKHLENAKIEIYAKSATEIVILGPEQFVTAVSLTGEPTRHQVSEDLSALFEYEIYNRIAKIVRTRIVADSSEHVALPMNR